MLNGNYLLTEQRRSQICLPGTEPRENRRARVGREVEHFSSDGRVHCHGKL